MRANRKVRSAGLEGGSDSFPLGRELRCSVCKNVRFATPKSGRSVIPLWRLPRLDISAELLRSPSAPPVQFRPAVRTLIQQLFAVGPYLEKGEIHALACYWVFGNLKRASLSQPSTLKCLRRGDRDQQAVLPIECRDAGHCFFQGQFSVISADAPAECRGCALSLEERPAHH